MKLRSKLAPLFVFAFLSISAASAGNFDGSATSGLWSKQQKLESKQVQLARQQQQYLQQQQIRQNRNIRLPFRTYPNGLPAVGTFKKSNSVSVTAKKTVVSRTKTRQAIRTTVKAKNNRNN